MLQRILISILLISQVSLAETIHVYNRLSEDTQPVDVHCGNPGEPLLVFLHSWMLDHTQYKSLRIEEETASRGWSLISPRFRGAELKEHRRNYRYALEDITAAIEAGAALCGPGDLYLYGSSGGGWMALNYVKKHPGAFSKIVLNNPIVSLLRWKRGLTRRESKYTERFVPDINQICSINGSFSRRRCKRISPWGIKKLKATIFWGEKDLVVSPLSHAKPLAKQLPNVTAIKISNRGHDIFVKESFEVFDAE